MSSHFKIPLLNPFKFVPNTDSPGIHFDDRWACEQIKSFELRAKYRQKWKKSETTKIQIESSISLGQLKIYNISGQVVKSISWTSVSAAISYSIYECTVDFSDLSEGVYFLFQRVNLLAIDWPAISEPIEVRNIWPNTLLFTYGHSFNDYDVAFTATNIRFKFRCEAGIMDYNPERERTAYVNQLRDVATLNGIPYRSFKLNIGEAPGVAPYVIDLLNRIFVCDYINIEGKLYQADTDSKWEVTRAKGYPLIGASIDIVESVGQGSLEFSETTPLAPGIVTAYNIETGFFGPGAVVPVTEVEENS